MVRHRRLHHPIGGGTFLSPVFSCAYHFRRCLHPEERGVGKPPLPGNPSRMGLMFNGFTRTRIDARGARVGHRMALDHSARVRTRTSLDVVPSQAAFDKMDKDLSFPVFTGI